MDAETATIWVKVGNSRKDSILIGGIYHKHQQLGLTNPDATMMEIQLQQESRWRKIVKNWRRARRGRNCVVIGDTNLDYQRWENPAHHLE